MMEVCYLDMDGCLSDFVKGAFDLFKVPHLPGTVKWDFHNSFTSNPNEFWGALDRKFWAGLEWMPEGQALLAGLEERFPNIVIMTSPCKTDGCMDGKLDWIKKHIPHYSRRYFMGTAKSEAASPRHLLVDDYDFNVEEFAKKGHSILVPRSWNKAAHKTVHNVFDVNEFFFDLDRKRIACSSA